MIYDRSYIDIINARKVFANKIQKFLELAEPEQRIIDRAFFNLTAVNRITAKINEIWDLVVDFGGAKTECADVREWGEQEIFKENNFSNIRKNISYIIQQLSALEFVEQEVYLEAYSKLTDDYIYTNLNNLEKLLFDIHKVLDGFFVQVGDVLYIFGAYSATFDEETGVLTLE